MTRLAARAAARKISGGKAIEISSIITALNCCPFSSSPAQLYPFGQTMLAVLRIRGSPERKHSFDLPIVSYQPPRSECLPRRYGVECLAFSQQEPSSCSKRQSPVENRLRAPAVVSLV